MPVKSFRRGNQVYFEVETKDLTQSPPARVDPDTVQITLKAPDGTSIVTGGTMTKVRLGIYKYTHQLDSVAALGAWTAEVKTTFVGATNISDIFTFMVTT